MLKKIVSIFSITLLSLAMISCSSSDKEDSSKNTEKEVSENQNPILKNKLYDINPEQFVSKFSNNVVKLVGKDVPMDIPTSVSEKIPVVDGKIFVNRYDLAKNVSLSGLFDADSSMLNSISLEAKLDENEKSIDAIKGFTAYFWLVASSYDLELNAEDAGVFINNMYAEVVKSNGAPIAMSKNGNRYTLSLENHKLQLIMARN